MAGDQTRRLRAASSALRVIVRCDAESDFVDDRRNGYDEIGKRCTS